MVKSINSEPPFSFNSGTAKTGASLQDNFKIFKPKSYNFVDAEESGALDNVTWSLWSISITK